MKEDGEIMNTDADDVEATIVIHHRAQVRVFVNSRYEVTIAVMDKRGDEQLIEIELDSARQVGHALIAIADKEQVA